MLAVLVHIDLFQCVVDALADFRLRNSHVLRRERNVLLDNGSNELVIRILEYHAHRLADIKQLVLVGGIYARDRDLAGGRREYRVEVLRKRGFSAAVVTQHRKELPLRNGQGNVLQNRIAAYFLAVLVVADVIKAKVFDFYNVQVIHPLSQKCTIAVLPAGSGIPVCFTGSPISWESTVISNRLPTVICRR